MHITLEADYALRIVDTLARQDVRMEAKAIAEKACVTLRFSLKILRKLVAAGIVRSYKGSQGGYEIAKPLDEITVYDILETIEGPLTLNRCILADHPCNRVPDKKCPYHHIFERTSERLKTELSSITIASLVQNRKQ
jgi:Rrf2 family protein